MNTLQIIIALILIAWTAKNLNDSIRIAKDAEELKSISEQLARKAKELEVMMEGVKTRLEFLQLVVDESKRRGMGVSDEQS